MALSGANPLRGRAPDPRQPNNHAIKTRYINPKPPSKIEHEKSSQNAIKPEIVGWDRKAVPAIVVIRRVDVSANEIEVERIER